MALATLKATINGSRTITVTRSTDNNGTSAIATIIFDNTSSMADVVAAIAGANRAVRRLFSQSDSPADVPTSGTSTE